MFRIGSKVQIHDFPPSISQSVNFDWNGLIGTVQDSKKIGLGLGGKAVYSYRVLFEDVKVPEVKRDPNTGKLKRRIKKGKAENWFDEGYLSLVPGSQPQSEEIEDDIEDEDEVADEQEVSDNK